MIKALAFDGNGVLYYRDLDFAVSLMDCIRDRWLPGFDVVKGLEEFRRFMVRAFDGGIGKSEAVGLFLDASGIADPETRADVTKAEIEYSRRIRLFPTEKETLLELDRRGFRLGMITNSFQSAAEKASWFRALSLDCIADTIVSSIDAGVSKPDAGIYLEFARRIGSVPGDIAFVGHEDFELAGARAAGMLPVSFSCAPEIRERHHLAVFSDLLAMFPAPGSTSGLDGREQ
jgi:FMN phosphatase YigB (HAD superfamily)